MIAALIDLEIGAASKSDLHLDQDFTIAYARYRHLLDLHVLFAVEDGGCHFPCQNLGSLSPGLAWADHDLHRIRLGIRRQLQPLNRLL